MRQRKSTLDVTERSPTMQDPYDFTRGVLTDTRITNEHLGQAVREAIAKNPQKHADVVQNAAAISAMEQAKAQAERA